MASADLLLHPVRARILKTLFGSDPLTTAQLRERLPDIPPATMYRHVAVLAEAGVLEVVEEKRVRGTVERSYRVRQDQAVVDPEAREAMSLEDHRRAFTAFSASLMADFERYLSSDGAKPAEDGVAYRQGAVWLTPEEYAELIEELTAVVVARTGNEPTPDRVRHVVSLVVVPDAAAEA
ncbi:helix-turn-helix domain-containing protein [Saccharopolyspora hordei]|uniref:DNA-binding transcriptional ArsR family regulator n=1 Tax=Saccharopolyspora hordei TaxID=1838 RepID=A0A853AVE5_9PSEU|nr:helix-turn-helix domain-containing protein [Saccharopolyspora hordei]NYI86630.1 DNA-binding transcriptional ArsR family regulator [Saccharopolyspora hordei]